MGCLSSSSAKGETNVAKDRRRLSVGNVADGTKGANSADLEKITENDRGLIAELNEQDVLKMLEDNGDRKFSVGSETDQAKTSFKDKETKKMGSDFKPEDEGLGYTCRKGLKPESPNQDSWSIVKFQGFSLYGVFDGHGKTGHDVSNFVKDNLPKLVIRDQRFKTDADAETMEAMMKDVYKRMQSLIATSDRTSKLSAQLAGTTCSYVIHDHAPNKLIVSHVADSTCVLGQWEDDAKTKIKAVAITKDHKPNDPQEKKRIEANGGRVVFDGYANHRVYAKNARYPGLNMSRCLGDLMGHADAGCSAVPDVTTVALTEKDHILLVCSDGVWEFLSHLEACQIVAGFAKKDAKAAADKLAKEAWDRWITEEGGTVVDDITVVLVYL